MAFTILKNPASHSHELRASHTHPYPKGYCLLSSPWLENNWVLWYQQKRENPQKSCYHDWPRFLEAASPAQPFGRQIIKIGRSETISHHHYYQLKRLLKPTMRFKKVYSVKTYLQQSSLGDSQRIEDRKSRLDLGSLGTQKSRRTTCTPPVEISWSSSTYVIAVAKSNSPHQFQFSEMYYTNQE